MERLALASTLLSRLPGIPHVLTPGGYPHRIVSASLSVCELGSALGRLRGDSGISDSKYSSPRPCLFLCPVLLWPLAWTDKT